ncbi:hypothetical protein [Picosynechococcus sp. PCC 7117]|uniref:hypothetical protein n=1 Tax=Picosynechococcus sp. PCC 7117 TaxID=195498 RepID=UPI00081059F4|nr:hypothetical protein [Picosynechococcus sp. PCC 7117]ANV89092.1 hypothetical protein AWQ22_16005 [Picosynechococcus sp. PCC 7117]
MGLATAIQALRGSMPTDYLPAIENFLDLVKIVCLRKGGHDVWAIANTQGDLTQFSFSASYQCIHSNEAHEPSMAGLLSVLKGLAEQEKLTFSTQVNSHFEASPAEHLPNPAAQLLWLNKDSTRRSLAHSKQRKQITYRIDSTFTVDGSAVDSDNGVEKFFSKVIRRWEALFTDVEYEREYDQLLTLFQSAYRAGIEFEKTLYATLKLDQAQLYDGDRLWEMLNQAIGGDSTLPYYLFVDLDDPHPEIQEFKRTGESLTGEPLSLLSQLFTDENFPRTHQEHLWLPARQQYCAILGFEDLPDEFTSPEHKYRWLWDCLISLDLSDYDLITQYSYASVDGVRKSLQNYTKQQLRTSNKNGQADQTAVVTSEEAMEAQRLIQQGDYPVYVGVAILVYAPNLDILRDKLTLIRKGFNRPTRLFQERDYVWRIWLQTLPIKLELLWRCAGFVTGDYRLSINASAALGLVNLTGIVNQAETGTEFISIQGGVPFRASLEDEFGSPRHGVVYGRTASGKSVLVGDMLVEAAFTGAQITSMDLVVPSETESLEESQKTSSTYSALIKFLGGTEFDPSREASNILELPDFSNFSPQTQLERREAFVESIEAMLQALVLDGVTDSGLATQVEFILTTAIARFYRDPEILDRIAQAQKQGIHSAAWQAYPTLQDFYERINYSLVQNDDEGQRQAVNFIRSALMSWIEGAMGKQIAQPSSVDFFRTPYLQFSCLKPSSEKKARVLGLMICNIAQRRALQCSRSIFYIDEASIWLEYAGLARYVGVQMATARKSGLTVILTTQDPVIIETNAASAKMRTNLSLRITGRINGDDIDHYQRIHRTPEAIISENVASTFKADPRRGTSQWLVDGDRRYTHGRYFASPILVGLLANNKAQVTARDRFFEQYPNPLEAAARWGAHFQTCMQQGKPLEDF